MFGRVLLCYDGSSQCCNALRRGAELAMIVNAQVSVLSIIPSQVQMAQMVAHTTGYGGLDSVKTTYYGILKESIDWLKMQGVAAKGYLVEGSDPIEEIVKHSERLQVDLIVLGDYPRSPGARWWSGPQRKSLAERTPVSILIAR